MIVYPQSKYGANYESEFTAATLGSRRTALWNSFWCRPCAAALIAEIGEMLMAITLLPIVGGAFSRALF